jgi:ferrochelatase
MSKKVKTNYQHGTAESLGILLVNLGTPDAATASAVRRYLKEFLSDRRVVEINRPLWWVILNTIILPFRSVKSAKLYKKIWTTAGSPLRVTLLEQAQELQIALQERFSGTVYVIPAMRYGYPAIVEGMNQLRELNARRVLVLPLYPQYSATTTASTFDAVADVLKTWRWQPELRFINQYADHPKYISAISHSIKTVWEEQGETQKLIFSFHGLPKRFLELGDPYHCFCQKTARLVAEALYLNPDQWMVTFQSRLGKAEWLKPYTMDVMKELPAKGNKSITMVCPGFPADCLETLEEIDQLNREIYIKAGGEIFQYVPALNALPMHIDFLADLVEQHCQGWPEVIPTWDHPSDDAAREISKNRAAEMGA